MFYYSIFGIACVELFMGRFQNRCGTPNFSSAYSVNVTGEVLLEVGWQQRGHREGEAAREAEDNHSRLASC
jgi:hypothetical protein